MAAAWRAWLDEVNAKAQLAEVCTLMPKFAGCQLAACICLRVARCCLHVPLKQAMGSRESMHAGR
jgi:hypothetical protein